MFEQIGGDLNQVATAPADDPLHGRDPRLMEISNRRLAGIYPTAHPAAQMLLDEVMLTPPLASGTEKVIYPYGYGENKVVAFMTTDWAQSYYSPEQQKVNFYRRKLLHLLLPQHIPDIHLAGTAPKMLILDRVEEPPTSEVSAVAAIRELFAVRRLCRKLDALGVRYQAGDINFMTDRTGTINYVDNVVTWNTKKPFVKSSIDKLEPQEKAKALRYLNRLEKLHEAA